jgi:hypothetical protein
MYGKDSFAFPREKVLAFSSSIDWYHHLLVRSYLCTYTCSIPHYPVIYFSQPHFHIPQHTYTHKALVICMITILIKIYLLSAYIAQASYQASHILAHLYGRKILLDYYNYHNHINSTKENAES